MRSEPDRRRGWNRVRPHRIQPQPLLKRLPAAPTCAVGHDRTSGPVLNAASNGSPKARSGDLSENRGGDQLEEPEDVRLLIRRSVSDESEVRVLASVGLSNFAEASRVAQRLRELVLDPENTMVTLVAVTALIARGGGECQPDLTLWRHHREQTPLVDVSPSGRTLCVRVG